MVKDRNRYYEPGGIKKLLLYAGIAAGIAYAGDSMDMKKSVTAAYMASSAAITDIFTKDAGELSQDYIRALSSKDDAGEFPDELEEVIIKCFRKLPDDEKVETAKKVFMALDNDEKIMAGYQLLTELGYIKRSGEEGKNRNFTGQIGKSAYDFLMDAERITGSAIGGILKRHGIKEWNNSG